MDSSLKRAILGVNERSFDKGYSMDIQVSSFC